jgi:hypothetical protein
MHARAGYRNSPRVNIGDLNKRPLPPHVCQVIWVGHPLTAHAAPPSRPPRRLAMMSGFRQRLPGGVHTIGEPMFSLPGTGKKATGEHF